MTDKPTITQADRDAAYNFNLYETGTSLRDSEAYELASYFANHRESAAAELQAEVDRLMTQNERFRVVLRIISTEHISIYRSSKAGRIATRVLEQNKPLE